MCTNRVWVTLNYTQADFLIGLYDAGKGKDFVRQIVALEYAEKYHACTVREGKPPYLAINNAQIELMLYRKVQLLQRAHLEDGITYSLTDDGVRAVRIMRGECTDVAGELGGYVKVIKEPGGDYTYKLYQGPDPAVFPPDEPKVPLTAKHVQTLLEALVGPDHHIRELQATRSLHKLDPAKYGNPIEHILDEYNSWIAKRA